MHRLITVLILVLALTPAHAKEARKRLDSFFTNVVTLDGRFSQVVVDERGEVIQESSGKVKLLRPGRFRWDYEKPFKQLIVSDGQYLWIYDSELAQATVKELGEALGTAPIMLLSEPRSLEEDFIMYDGGPAEGLEWVELQPKVADTDFKRIRFGLDQRGVQRMVLFDQFGQQTIIRFQGVKFNTEIPASAFRFDVPPGVDVIGPN